MARRSRGVQGGASERLTSEPNQAQRKGADHYRLPPGRGQFLQWSARGRGGLQKKPGRTAMTGGGNGGALVGARVGAHMTVSVDVA